MFFKDFAKMVNYLYLHLLKLGAAFTKDHLTGAASFSLKRPAFLENV